GGRKELDAYEVEQQIFAVFFFDKGEQLIAELLNIRGVDDLSVEKADGRYLAAAGHEVGNFDTTMNSHRSLLSAERGGLGQRKLPPWAVAWYSTDYRSRQGFAIAAG